MRKGIATVGISLFLHLFGRGEAKKRRWYYTWEQKRSTDRFLANNWTLIAVKKARMISIKQLSSSPFILVKIKKMTTNNNKILFYCCNETFAKSHNGEGWWVDEVLCWLLFRTTMETFDPWASQMWNSFKMPSI